jgi:hypothetical protein
MDSNKPGFLGTVEDILKNTWFIYWCFIAFLLTIEERGKRVMATLDVGISEIRFCFGHIPGTRNTKEKKNQNSWEGTFST